MEIPSFISIDIYHLSLSTEMADEVQGRLVGFWFKSLKLKGTRSST